MLSEAVAFCRMRQGAFIDYWDGRWVSSQLDVVTHCQQSLPNLDSITTLTSSSHGLPGA